MSASQTAITREVRRWMAEAKLTQADVAGTLGLSQPAMSKRLRGITRWSLDDLDALIAQGVPVGFALYGELACTTPEVVR